VALCKQPCMFASGGEREKRPTKRGVGGWTGGKRRAAARSIYPGLFTIPIAHFSESRILSRLVSRRAGAIFRASRLLEGGMQVGIVPSGASSYGPILGNRVGKKIKSYVWNLKH
jgi:hypothetical protein